MHYIAGTPEIVKQKCDDLTKAGVTQIIFGFRSVRT
jgi:5,10-methylenetetrahydromethanopterin reductase